MFILICCASARERGRPKTWRSSRNAIATLRGRNGEPDPGELKSSIADVQNVVIHVRRHVGEVQAVQTRDQRNPRAPVEGGARRTPPQRSNIFRAQKLDQYLHEVARQKRATRVDPTLLRKHAHEEDHAKVRIQQRMCKHARWAKRASQAQVKDAPGQPTNSPPSVKLGG